MGEQTEAHTTAKHHSTSAAPGSTCHKGGNPPKQKAIHDRKQPAVHGNHQNSHTDKQKTKSRAAACCGKLCELYMASYSQNVTAVRGQSPSKPMSNSSSEFMCTTCSCISYVFMSSHAFYGPFGMAFVSRVLRLLGGLARFTTHKQSRELTWACAEQRPPLFAHAGHRASEQTLQQYP